MSIITLRLLNEKYAPWGLLTDEPQPRTIVWLTIAEPEGNIRSEILSDWDLSRIMQGKNLGIISVDGLNFPQQETINSEPQMNIDEVVSAAKSTTSYSQKLPSSEVLDVTKLLREESEKSKEIAETVSQGYPEVDVILKLPANKLRKKLKQMAKENFSISFFKNCKKKEERGKSRKTVIALLVDIITAKIAAIDVEGKYNVYTGKTSLDDQYYDMIEEFDDEEDK
jgi:hypothetical protein